MPRQHTVHYNRLTHIKPETVRKCLKSDTLLACSVRHSYEENPLVRLNHNKFGTEFILRQYVNVKEQLEIGMRFDIIRDIFSGETWLDRCYTQMGNNRMESYHCKWRERLPNMNIATITESGWLLFGGDGCCKKSVIWERSVVED